MPTTQKGRKEPLTKAGEAAMRWRGGHASPPRMTAPQPRSMILQAISLAIASSGTVRTVAKLSGSERTRLWAITRPRCAAMAAKWYADEAARAVEKALTDQGRAQLQSGRERGLTGFHHHRHPLDEAVMTKASNRHERARSAGRDHVVRGGWEAQWLGFRRRACGAEALPLIAFGARGRGEVPTSCSPAGS